MLTLTGHGKTPDEFCSNFFDSLKKGEIEKAYDDLFEGSPIVSAKPQGVQMIKTQTKSGLSMYGSILDTETVTTEEFGKSVVRKTFILKTEMAPLTFEFFFYKPKDKWFLYNILFNDEIPLLRSYK